jgi:hypothetical protein
VEEGDGERYSRVGRDGELKLAGREDESKESVLIIIDGRMGPKCSRRCIKLGSEACAPRRTSG